MIPCARTANRGDLESNPERTMTVRVESARDSYEATKPQGTATRRLCAGVYIDPIFRSRVLRDAYVDRVRRIAPSYGYDVVPVLIHAWRAWLLETIYGLGVLTIIMYTFVLAPWTALVAISLSAMWYVGLALLRLGRDAYAYLHDRKTYSESQQLHYRIKPLRYGFIVCTVTLTITVILSVQTAARSDGQNWLTRQGPIGAAYVILALCLATIANEGIRQFLLLRLRTQDLRRVSHRNPRLATIAIQQRHPVVVYSRYTPFIGSGTEVSTWSFAQRLIHKKSGEDERDVEFSHLPFTIEEVVGCVRESVEALAEDVDPHTRLPGIEVDDRIFIEGLEAVPYLDLLTKVPRSTEIAALLANSNGAARHYLACQVESWGGEIVTSVFVHASLQGRMLYFELAIRALSPTPARYRIIHEIRGVGLQAGAHAIKERITSPSILLAELKRLAKAPLLVWGGACAEVQSKVADHRNIGAKFSVRDAAASGRNEKYFQTADIFQYSKIIERRVLASVGELLESRGVDVSEFIKRTNAILNNGVINSGPGNVNIDSSAIGKQANVNNNGSDPDSD
jgi:hypothetical protein